MNAAIDRLLSARVRGSYAYMALGAAVVAALALWITVARVPSTPPPPQVPGTVAVPPMPAESVEEVPPIWAQPRNSPGGPGVWGPDVSAPFDTLWRIHTGLEFFAAPAVHGGVLYFGGNDGRLRAVDASTGAEAWGHATSCGLSGESAVDSQRVFFGGQDGYLYALDRRTGALDWSAGLGYSVFSGVGLLRDSLVIAGNSEGSVAALGARDGRVVWHDSPGGLILGPAVLDTIAVFTSEAGTVAAYGMSGRRAWCRDFQGVASAPSISDGSVFAGFSDGVVRRLSLADGSVTWEADVAPGPGRCTISRPIARNGRLYLGTCDSRVLCLDESTGETLWESRMENWVQLPPAVGDSTVYVSCDDQRLHVLSAGDGSEILAVELGGYSGSAPLLVNGVLYLGTARGDFFAFRGTQRERPEESVPGQGGE